MLQQSQVPFVIDDGDKAMLESESTLAITNTWDPLTGYLITIR